MLQDKKLQNYMRRNGYPGRFPPPDLSIYVLSDKEYRNYCETSKLDADSYGLALKRTVDCDIYINRDVPLKEQKITILHELGHYLVKDNVLQTTQLINKMVLDEADGDSDVIEAVILMGFNFYEEFIVEFTALRECLMCKDVSDNDLLARIKENERIILQNKFSDALIKAYSDSIAYIVAAIVATKNLDVNCFDNKDLANLIKRLRTLCREAMNYNKRTPLALMEFSNENLIDVYIKIAVLLSKYYSKLN